MNKKITILSIVSLVVELTQSILVARILGPSTYGEIAVVMAIITLFQGVLGVRSAEIVYGYIDKKNNQLTKIKKIYAIDAISSIVVFFTLLIITNTILVSFLKFNYEIMQFLTYIMISRIGYFVSEALMILNNKIYIYNLIKALNSIITLLIVIFITIIFKLKGYIIIIPIMMLFTNLLLFMYVKKKIINFNKHGPSDLDGIIKFSSQSFVSATLKSFSNTADILILNFISNVETIGLYKVGKTLGQIPNGILNALWQPHYGIIISKAKKKLFFSLNRYVGKLNINLISMSILGIIIYILIGEFLLIKIYGYGYEKAYIYTLIFLIGNSFSYSIAAYGRLYYTAINKMNYLIFVNLIPCIFILIFFVLRKMDGIYMAVMISLSLIIGAIIVRVDLMVRSGMSYGYRKY